MAMTRGRRIILVILVIFAVYSIYKNPTQSADWVKQGFVGLSAVVRAVFDFFNALVKK